MVYTLGQAAKATDKSKSTILKSIKSGRISAQKNDIGDWEIDPAELHRIYPLVSENGSLEHQSARQETPGELIELRVRIEALHEQNGLLKDDRDDLRRRLDQSEEERRKTQAQLTALLTDQRQKEEPPPLPPPPPPSPHGFWHRFWNAKFSL